MKKSGLLLAAAAVAGMLLTGCGASQKSTFSPSVSCVYVAQDGSVSSALVKEYEGDTVNSKDLQQYLEAAVIRFNQENGAQGMAENKIDVYKRQQRTLRFGKVSGEGPVCRAGKRLPQYMFKCNDISG